MSKPISEAQLRAIAYLVNTVPVSPERLTKAMRSAKDAYHFIGDMKPKVEKLQKAKQAEAQEDLPPTEARIFNEIRTGTCPDHKAEIRGRAIADLLGIQPTAMNEDLPNAYRGLYREVIGVVLETPDVTTEIKICAACQLELTVEYGDEACPRCGSKLQNIE